MSASNLPDLSHITLPDGSEGMLMDALEKTGANAFYIVWLPDIKTWRMTMYCEERLIYAEGPTRLAALCEAVLKAAGEKQNDHS